MSTDKYRTTQIVIIPKASASTENSSTSGKKDSKLTKKNKKFKEEENVNDQKEQISNNAETEKSGKSSDSTDVIKRIDEAVNPVGLGRKSRQIFDEVWKKFSNLGQISRTEYDDVSSNNLLAFGEFTIPDAQNTTVLVIGASSRIGRLVVRKLMLRGYTVKVIPECQSSMLLLFFMFYVAL